MRRSPLSSRPSVVALAAAAGMAAVPSIVNAGDTTGSRVIIRTDRARTLSDILIASQGKLAVRATIAPLKATVLVGKGEWAALDPTALAEAVRALARASKLELRDVEIDTVSRAEGDCCVELKLPKSEDELAKVLTKLHWPHRALGLENHAADAKGTLVAILDTGVDREHPLLKGSLAEGENLSESDRDVDDRNGHGTAMAGVIAAHGDSPTDVRGIAPNARILPVKVMDERGTGDVATLAQGIVRATDRGARVILVSAGVAAPSRLLEDAVRYARSKDAIVVAAAGNEPLGRALYPAATPGALAVTATREPGKLALACALDPLVELAAPGDEIHTTLPRNTLNGTAVLSGTSFSAAFVAGVAALGIAQGHSSDEVLRALRGARHEIPAVRELARFLPLGELDAKLALERLEQSDRAVEAVWTVPAVARAGGSLTVKARVRSTGGRVTAPGTLSIFGGESPLGTISLPQLPTDGTAVEVEATIALPEQLGTELALSVRLSPDDDSSNDVRAISVPAIAHDSTAVARLGITGMAVEDERGTLAVTVENQGEEAETPVVGATLEGNALASVETAKAIAPGAQSVVRFALPALKKDSPIKLVAAVKGRAGTVTGRLDARLAGKDPRPVRPQYQQSNGVDLIADAPWRLEPGRAYLPVMIFVPSKGDGGDSIDFTLDSARVIALDDPTAASGSLLYNYANGTPVSAQDPSQIASGTTILDENGDDLGSLNLFKDATLTDNGHHEIFRFPRGAFGVADQPQAATFKYVDVKLHYASHRYNFWGTLEVDSADYHKVLRVTFDSRPLPVLPGDGHYYDTHCHTIAEWYFSSQFDLLAPRKAYGGPIVMIREAAFALGLTDSAQPAPGSIITTDHSCFNNTEDPDCNDGLRRIQIGPTAPQNSLDSTGTVETQLARFHELFGVTANEEIAFFQNQNFSLASMILGVPLGAHMLAFRAGHWEERWNGGNGGASPNQRPYGTGQLQLHEALDAAAKKDPTTFRDAFFYSAHAFSSQGWDAASLDDALELTPGAGGLRDGRYTNDSTDSFVFKGHQLWNRHASHELPTDKIDWSNLNPWADPAFQQGRGAWGRELETGILAYHTHVSQLLNYCRSSEPGRVFPRKLYVAAGSDAHGDFNFEEQRLATPVPIASTWDVNDSAFGRARTYVFEDGMTGPADGTRALDALAAGHSVVTDGPLVKFALDSNSRFDGTNLVYHDATQTFEDADGRIGGGGVGPDGAGTALVVAGSTDAVLSYRYEDAPDAAVGTIELYQVQQGGTAASRTVHDSDAGDDYQAPAPVATLALGGTDTDLSAIAGVFTGVTALQLGAFAGGDPSQGALAADARRCYTNPIWVAPVSVEWVTNNADTTNGVIAAGQLRVRFHFPLSMQPAVYQVEVKALDATGTTTNGTFAGYALAPDSGQGWSVDPATGITNGVYEVVNQQDISARPAELPDRGDGDVRPLLPRRPERLVGQRAQPDRPRADRAADRHAARQRRGAWARGHDGPGLDRVVGRLRRLGRLGRRVRAGDGRTLGPPHSPAAPRRRPRACRRAPA